MYNVVVTTTDRYATLKAAGICPRCAKRPRSATRLICAPCIEAEAARRPEQMKARYVARLAAGLCTRCGKRNALTGNKSCELCRTVLLERARQASDEAKEHRRALHRVWRAANPDNDRARSLTYRRKLKAAALARYGTACQCCHEDNPAFLTLDHINGDGNTHRRALFGANISGTSFYKKLRQAGWPDGLQTLCWNCNMAKAHYGICPHVS